MGSRTIVGRFARDGYVFPVDVLSPDQAAEERQELEALEWRTRGSALGNKGRSTIPM